MNCSEGFRLSSLSGKTCLQFSFLTVSQEYSRSFQSISTQAENHRRSKSALTFHQSMRRDPKCNPRASSDARRVSAWPTPYFPARECLCAAAAARNHSPPTPALAAWHRQSADRCSSKLCLCLSENQSRALVPLTSPLSRGRSFQKHASQTETDRRLSCRPESNQARAPTSLLCRSRRE